MTTRVCPECGKVMVPNYFELPMIWQCPDGIKCEGKSLSDAFFKITGCIKTDMTTEELKKKIRRNNAKSNI